MRIAHSDHHCRNCSLDAEAISECPWRITGAVRPGSSAATSACKSPGHGVLALLWRRSGVPAASRWRLGGQGAADAADTPLCGCCADTHGRQCRRTASAVRSLSGRCAGSTPPLCVHQTHYCRRTTALRPPCHRSAAALWPNGRYRHTTATVQPPRGDSAAAVYPLCVLACLVRPLCGWCVAVQRRNCRRVAAIPSPLRSRSTAAQWRLCGDIAPLCHLLRDG